MKHNNQKNNYQTHKKNSAAFLIALGIGSLALTVLQLTGLVNVSYSGRWAWLKESIYQYLGPNGPLLFSGLLGLILLAIGINGYNSNQGK